MNIREIDLSTATLRADDLPRVADIHLQYEGDLFVSYGRGTIDVLEGRAEIQMNPVSSFGHRPIIRDGVIDLIRISANVPNGPNPVVHLHGGEFKSDPATGRASIASPMRRAV